VMRGYFGDDESTRAVLKDGWFHTGDVGRLDDEGYLYITDRLKDLLVTAGGKKVAPQPVEALLKSGPWISEAVLLGDRRPFIIALLVPNFAQLESEARAHGWTFATREELIRRPEALALYQPLVDAANAGKASFEQVKRFALLPRELTAEAGELTPKLSVRRRVVLKNFEPIIDGLYAHGRVAPTPA
jgi:long-chain acyl-CoA synthetase